MAAAELSHDLVVRSANALVVEIFKQTGDVVAAGEIRDLAEALALLAPLTHQEYSKAEVQPRL